MKKLFLVLVVVATVSLGLNMKVNASTREIGREIKNILDLTNFKMDFETLEFNTINPIEVEIGKTYTIAADKDFIGHSDFVSLDIVYENNTNETIELVYITDYFVLGMFTPKEDLIHINNFNFIGVGNANVMLYKGDDSDFEEYYMPYVINDNYTRGYLEIDYDYPLSVLEIDSYVQSINPQSNEDVRVVRSRNQYKHEIGTYEALYYSILNNINNVFYLEIKVVDKTAPVINTDELSYGSTDKPSLDNILSDIKITDNADTITKDAIFVIDTNYKPENGVGYYHLNIRVTDNSNNISEKKINITINDDISPNIIGPNALFIYTTNSPLTHGEILKNFLITDDFTNIEDLTIEIIGEYNETIIAGKYNIIIKATDSANNETIKEIVIHVIDNIQSEYIIDPIIKTTPKKLVSESEIIDIFIEESKKIGISITDVVVNKDIYELNYNKVGEYKTYIEYLLDGSPKYAEVTILVADEGNRISPFIYVIPIVIILTTTIVIISKKRRQSN